ncbi:MAG: hypothetical protein ACXIUL_03740 [Wenzhouxiangella sp.]
MRTPWLFPGLLLLVAPAFADFDTVITFDELVTGETVFSFDGDGDGVADAIFSTTDPNGFNTVGPGANQLYIDEPGLEGTTQLSPDLRVDFPFGAVDGFRFGFAMSASTESPNLTVTFRVFDAADTLLAEVTELAVFSDLGGGAQSSFPEAEVSVEFDGAADYATFDFNGESATRYIIDNFAGTFGSLERPGPTAPIGVPMLSSWSVLTLIMMMLLIAGILRTR